MFQLLFEAQKPPKERNGTREGAAVASPTCIWRQARGRRQQLAVSSHLFVGVKLFVRLMSEPAIKTGRDVRTGKEIGTAVTPQKCHFPPFRFKIFILLILHFGNRNMKRCSCMREDGEGDLPTQRFPTQAPIVLFGFLKHSFIFNEIIHAASAFEVLRKKHPARGHLSG